jgi:hypothetical protein
VARGPPLGEWYALAPRRLRCPGEISAEMLSLAHSPIHAACNRDAFALRLCDGGMAVRVEGQRCRRVFFNALVDDSPIRCVWGNRLAIPPSCGVAIHIGPDLAGLV